MQAMLSRRRHEPGDVVSVSSWNATMSKDAGEAECLGQAMGYVVREATEWRQEHPEFKGTFYEGVLFYMIEVD